MSPTSPTRLAAAPLRGFSGVSSSPKPKQPTKGALAALKAMRLYHSLRSDLRARAPDEAKLLHKAQRACAREAKRMGENTERVWEEVEREAFKQGPLTPVLGVDL